MGMLADSTPPAAQVLCGARKKAMDAIPEGHEHVLQKRSGF